MLNTIILFIISFSSPFIFFRIILTLLSHKRDQTTSYIREGRKFHHLHFGVGILIVGIIGFLVLGTTAFPTIISGIGLGMILDDFIPSLYIPEPEPQTTNTYFGSFFSTFFLLLFITIIILTAYFFIELLS